MAAEGFRSGPVIHECFGVRIGRNVVSHGLALGPNPSLQGLHSARRAAQPHHASSPAFSSADGKGRLDISNGLISWGHVGSGFRRPQ